MKTFSRYLTFRFFALLTALAFAASGALAQSGHRFSQPELDQMLAPVALYPDALLAQILMAASYPLEVQEAARWARDRPELSGEAAVSEAEMENWDPSVKSLVAFPELLARMAENPQWTQALGDAFLAQQPQVMDSVQTLRRRAQTAGNLRSDERMSVVESGNSLMLQSYDPELVYVPYYDPQVAYGSWWWPSYPPVYLRPWRGYYARPAYASGFYWGAPAAISAGFFFGGIDWHQRRARVVHTDNYYNRLSPSRRTGAPDAWQRGADHRRGPADRGDAQQRFGPIVPIHGGQARLAETGPDARIEARRSGAPIESRRPDEFRRPDARSRVDLRPNAPAATAAPVDIRIEARRPNAQPLARSAAPPAAPPANANRVEIRQDARAAAGGAPTTWASGAAPETRRGTGPGHSDFGGARFRTEGQPHTRPAQLQAGVQIDSPRAPQARLDLHPAPAPARPEAAAFAPRQPAEHLRAPQASLARPAPPAPSVVAPAPAPAPAAAPRHADGRPAGRGRTGP